MNKVVLINGDAMKPYPLKYWAGMMDWLRGTMLGEGKISEEDFDLIHVTDSPEEVVAHVVSSQPKGRS